MKYKPDFVLFCRVSKLIWEGADNEKRIIYTQDWRLWTWISVFYHGKRDLPSKGHVLDYRCCLLRAIDYGSCLSGAHRCLVSSAAYGQYSSPDLSSRVSQTTVWSYRLPVANIHVGCHFRLLCVVCAHQLPDFHRSIDFQPSAWGFTTACSQDLWQGTLLLVALQSVQIDSPFKLVPFQTLLLPIH